MKKPYVFLITDRSGSMRSYIPKVDETINNIITQNSHHANIGIIPFTNYYLGLHMNPKAPIELPHRGDGTRIMDAIISSINDIGAMCNGSDKVMILVLTDGEDVNSEHSEKKVRREVERVEGVFSWDFLFVGTNQNAEAVGREMGVQTSKTLSFACNTKGWDAMLNELSNVCEKWITGNLQGSDDFFSSEAKSIQTSLGAIRI